VGPQGAPGAVFEKSDLLPTAKTRRGDCIELFRATELGLEWAAAGKLATLGKIPPLDEDTSEKTLALGRWAAHRARRFE
jgi:hypothetical protein